MTEFEYLELIIAARDSLGYHAMNYFTFLFGYLLAAYFIGHLLTRFQLISLTALYAGISPFPCIASYQSAREHATLTIEYYSKFKPGVVPPEFTADGFLILPYFLTATWIMSVVFMVQSRRVRLAAKDTPIQVLDTNT